MELTDKQKKFADEYLVDLNATQAAIRAGYSKKTAQQMGSENLLKPVIRDYINTKQLKLQEKTEITVEWIMEELVNNYSRCSQKIQVFDEEGNPTGEWRYEVNPSLKCLELLGKHLGMFKDKIELSGQVEVDVNIKSRLTEKINKLIKSNSSSKINK